MASGLLKPNAIRVRSRILVFVLSTRPLDSRWSRAASIASRCLLMRRASSMKLGMRQAPGPAEPGVQQLLAFFSLEPEYLAELLFEQVGPEQLVVDLRDPGELGLLPVGEVLGVLPQRVAGALEVTGRACSSRPCGRRSRCRGGPGPGRHRPTRGCGTGRRSGPRSGSARRPRRRSTGRRRPRRA